jgi:uncharacterized protein
VVKAVLDTNIVVSAHLKAEGREALILELALAAKFKLCASEPIFEEYEAVLMRPRFGFDPQKIAKSLKAIRKVSLFVRPRKPLRVARDPDDDKFLECALEAGAECLVTGNLRHFPARFRGTRVVSPRESLVILAAQIE